MSALPISIIRDGVKLTLHNSWTKLGTETIRVHQFKGVKTHYDDTCEWCGQSVEKEDDVIREVKVWK